MKMATAELRMSPLEGGVFGWVHVCLLCFPWENNDHIHVWRKRKGRGGGGRKERNKR